VILLQPPKNGEKLSKTMENSYKHNENELVCMDQATEFIFKRSTS
jgi:hypothetical protein